MFKWKISPYSGNKQDHRKNKQKFNGSYKKIQENMKKFEVG